MCQLIELYDESEFRSYIPRNSVTTPNTSRPNVIPAQNPVGMRPDSKAPPWRTSLMKSTIHPPIDTKPYVSTGLRYYGLIDRVPSTPMYAKRNKAITQTILLFAASAVLVPCAEPGVLGLLRRNCVASSRQNSETLPTSSRAAPPTNV